MNFTKNLNLVRLKRLLLVLIILSAFFIRVCNLNSPGTYFFDEVYHAYTAEEHLKGNIASYQYWQSPPPGVAYVWDHPAMGSLMITSSLYLLGDNSFAWRIAPALAGTMTVFGIWLLAKLLFKRDNIALLAAALVAIEGLAITESRMAGLDAFATNFIVFSLILYVKFRQQLFSYPDLPKKLETRKAHRKKLLTYLFGWTLLTGLAFATKWNTFYLVGIFATDMLFEIFRAPKAFFRKWKFLLFSGVVFVVGIIACYLFAYIQFFILGNSLKVLWETIQQTWWYHTNLKATHPYQSVPWQWILSLKPVYMYYNASLDGQSVTAIANVGNYGILGFGFLAIIMTVAKLVRKFRWSLFFILSAYFWLFLPWAFSPRIMFFYHYLPSATLLSIPLALVLVKGWRSGEVLRSMVILILVIIFIIFLILLPFNNGLPVSTVLFDSFYVKLL